MIFHTSLLVAEVTGAGQHMGVLGDPAPPRCQRFAHGTSLPCHRHCHHSWNRVTCCICPNPTCASPSRPPSMSQLGLPCWSIPHVERCTDSHMSSVHWKPLCSVVLFRPAPVSPNALPSVALEPCGADRVTQRSRMDNKARTNVCTCTMLRLGLIY